MSFFDFVTASSAGDTAHVVRSSAGATVGDAAHSAAARVAPALLALLVLATPLIGCVASPSPLTPHLSGSIGAPNRGVLTAGAQVPCGSEGLRCLRDNDRHFGLPRFVAAIERAASTVARQRPGAMLTVGDLSVKTGGKVSSHASHRTGRDADLLLYVTTLDGVPVSSPDFVHVGNDGLAWDPTAKEFLRFDVEREWLLVKALVTDPEARIQWLFVSRPVKAMLIEWARARGESGETLTRAMEMLTQPSPPAQNHDDHIHVRTACAPDDVTRGCEPTGPIRAWVAAYDASRTSFAVDALESTTELVEAIARPIRPAEDVAVANDAANKP